MPLSDREQHLLEQMEQALYAEDPKFASHMRGVGARVARRRYLVGIVGFLVGLALVLLGVNLSKIWIGAIGFVVMVAAVWQAVAPPKAAKPVLGAVQTDGSVKAATPAKRGPHGRKTTGGSAPSSGTFMQRMEERWERRRGQW
ncbi:MAG: DUF3040 domain-containing protein [Nostocoides sp.]